MTIPGQITFVFLIWRLAADHTRLSVIFIILYICAALIQVRLSFFFRKDKRFYLH